MKRVAHILFLGAATSILLVTTFSCKQKSREEATLVNRAIEEERTSEFSEAIKDEMMQLRNPTLGRIPEGARELELAEAEQVLQDQLLRAGNQLHTEASTYTFQGPDNLGGRTRSIAFDVSDATANTIISGSVSGGVFRTTNGGTSWTRTNPSLQHFSVTAIAQDPRPGNQNRWYYGGGEALGNSAGESTLSGASAPFYTGDGIYSSTDGGLTWTKLPTSNTGSVFAFDNLADLIHNIAVNPVNGDIYAACVGKVMRSQDFGATWVDVIADPGASNSGFITDVTITSTGRVYVAFSGNSTASFDGVWTSPTGNSGSFTHIAGTGSATNPAGWNAVNTYGRLVLAIAPSNENLVYGLYYNNTTSNCAGTPAPEGEFYRWDLAGNSWTALTLPDEAGCSNGNDPFACQGGYDLVVGVKPNDPNTVFVGGTNAYRSTDGGLTWTRIGGYASSGSAALYANHHPDIHAFEFGPASNDLLFCGSDGGIHRADITIPAVSWTSLNNGYRTYQYYHVAIKPESGVNDFIGGAQDNGTTTTIGGGINMTRVLPGDGVAVGLASGAAPYNQFGGAQNGIVWRRTSNLAPDFATTITPTGAASIFVTYFYLDPDNTDNLYYACQVSGNNRILRTINSGTVASGTWTTMTFNYNGYVRSMAATRGAYSATSRLYLGTTNGRLYRLTDPRNAAVGTAPDDITPTGMAAANNMLMGIAVNPTNHNEIMAVYSNYGIVNIWYTANAGAASPTWVNAEGNLSAQSVRCCMIVQDGANTEYYVGTGTGLYKTNSMAGAITWSKEAPTEIGNAVVRALALRPADNTFAIGTHGLGMWKGVVSFVTPVTLTNFTGKLVNNKVQLDWKTLTESNSKVFEIERSYDGNNFTKIGSVNAAGNSTTERSYTFTDPAVAQEVNYYRLRQVDIDNKYTYSPQVLVKNLFRTKADFRVLNNPFVDYIDIKLTNQQANKAFVRLIDMGGRIVYTNNFNTNLPRIRIPLGDRTLPRSVYLLEVIAGTNRYTSKVVRQ